MHRSFPCEKDLDGFNEFIPSDHIPVAGLPDAIRDQKSAWLNTVSVRAVFSAEVEDGDLVIPVVREGSNDWQHPDTMWIPALSVDKYVQERPLSISYKAAFYGVAYKRLNRVMLGPLVYHPSYRFPPGAYLYALPNGKIGVTPTEIVAGVCLAPGYVLLHTSVQDIRLFEQVSEKTDDIIAAARLAVDTVNAGVERIEELVNISGLTNGVACSYQVWTLDSDVAIGDYIELPNSQVYLPGRNHILVSYDGVVLSRSWFDEVAGDPANYGLSNKLLSKMAFSAGQELSAWVSPLGLADVPDLVSRVAVLEKHISADDQASLTARVTSLEDALADLSRRVVYAEPEN